MREPNIRHPRSTTPIAAASTAPRNMLRRCEKTARASACRRRANPPRIPTLNLSGERLKVQEVYLREYETMADALKNIEHFIEIVYTKKRLHASLDYRTPEEFEETWKQQQNLL
jgi:transposase InsO family protein